MAQQIVSREEFLAHIEKLLAKQTQEPCTLETPYPVYERATRQQVGTGIISFFVDNGMVEANDSLRGDRCGVVRMSDIMPVLDEEQQRAEKKGVELRYVIGRKADPYAMEKRGDDPGTF